MKTANRAIDDDRWRWSWRGIGALITAIAVSLALSGCPQTKPAEQPSVSEGSCGPSDKTVTITETTNMEISDHYVAPGNIGPRDLPDKDGVVTPKVSVRVAFMDKSTKKEWSETRPGRTRLALARPTPSTASVGTKRWHFASGMAAGCRPKPNGSWPRPAVRIIGFIRGVRPRPMQRWRTIMSPSIRPSSPWVVTPRA